MRAPIFLTLLACTLPLGFVSATLAVVFHHAIIYGTQFFAQTAFFISDATPSIPALAIVVLPALGGLLVGLLLYITRAPEVAGEGVPAVHKACVHSGRIRTRVLFLKPLASIITLSSGGSAGREGPIIQIGAALGSVLGQRLKLQADDIKTLLIAGAAGAMAATFGTPLAALFFAFEVLRRDSRLGSFFILSFTIICSSLSALYIFNFKGLEFTLTTVPALGTLEYILILILGILGGLCAVGFGKTLALVRKFFDRVPLPRFLLPAVGGLLVGLLTLVVPSLPEHASYPLMQNIVGGAELPIVMLILIIAAKILATALTIESGGSGGIFAPLLLIGVVLGSVLENVLATIFTFVTPATVLFPLLGMAALLGGAAHAPLSAIVMLIEMTDQTSLLLPLILVSYVAYVVMRLFSTHSLYHHSRIKGNGDHL